MKKAYFLIGFTLFLQQLAQAEKRKILFLGNSYTYVNDLPNTLKQLALSLGDSIEVDSYCPGGSTLNSLYNDANTLAKIQLPGWDYVVVQAQSQEPSFSPVQVAADTYPFAKKLDSLIHISNPCAETIFYMTWGRKNGDAGNCAAYPPVCTFEGMQQRLRESYLEMSADNHATCSPVGVAWRTCRSQFPAVELYNPDESHPSANGTYLAACVFYSTLYQKTSLGAPYVLAGVAAADATNLQTIASQTVLDSIENWQQAGHLPHADFSYNIAQNNVSFTNTSLRSANYDWDFGDASPSVQTPNPVHVYSAVGTYTVTLKSMSACNRYSLATRQISIATLPNSITETLPATTADLYYASGKIFLKKGLSELSLFDMTGKLIWQKRQLDAGATINCANLPTGLYFYRAVNQHKSSSIQGKWMIR